MERAFFLGLASGGACLATCGPLVGAFLAAEQVTVKRSAMLLALFLAGRLCGYGGWAVGSWILGRVTVQDPWGLTALAAADLFLGGWLIHYGLSHPCADFHRPCPASQHRLLSFPMVLHRPVLRSAFWGLLSGLQVCPPFLAAVTEAARAGSLGGSLLFFLVFYAGTALWFIPFPLIGKLGRFRQAAQVARFCTVPLGAYYIYSGLTAFTGGN
jgi:sulfite exporter TauE/SafE